MEPSKANETSASKIPDFNQRYSQRQTVPIAGEHHDDIPPPPYEPSGYTPSASGPAPTVSADSARSSTSSVRDEDAGFLGNDRTTQQQTSIASKDDDDDSKWAHTKDQPGFLCSDTGGCIYSSRDGCCWSDRGGCIFSDTDGCCWSAHGGCCCSDHGGCCFASNDACCCSGYAPRHAHGLR
nr:uncharacterized protein CTRU02_02183 [Colletotrichum truncatum]KAF6799311.1 hypothetical protein CTRU02_02183 [Colletotrichum truncatum]